MRRILAMLISAFFFVSCASAIQVDSDYVLDYLYKEKIQKGQEECVYGYENGLYVYNCIISDRYYVCATSAPDSDDLKTRNDAVSWEVDSRWWIDRCAESKTLLDESGMTEDSVMVVLSCNIGSAIKPIYLPLLIVRDDTVLYNISDSIQPAE